MTDKNKNKKYIHGGEIYGKDIELDLSVNLNPLGPPECVMTAVERAGDKLINYPEYDSLSLRRKAAGCYGVKPGEIVCGNGASELIAALGRLFRGGKVLIPVPCFTGYERGFKESRIIYHELRMKDRFGITEEIIKMVHGSKPEAVILGNPTNPSGVTAERDLLIELIITAGKTGTVVIVDESFIELCDKGEGASLVDVIKYYDNLIVLRSVTKAYAVPGLRLGFAICSNDAIRKRLASELPEWNVSVFAGEAGKAIFKDPDRVRYLERAGDVIKDCRKRLRMNLETAGIESVPGECCYLLLHTDRKLKEEMGERKILIRQCGDMRGLGKNWYRIAVNEASASIVF
ncbi:MAG: aminotransferase class I/II-fold pyridoxal phosphate-dependent enzyme [Lachnospiraceae bacterium]|nr:aminotransferase class I/II-fold pyridoxal phosphate-dependent enzyme [Lachnospiraceae bacterium]